MDMNFPHETLECAEGRPGDDVPARFADHRALLARAIARQASSPSAKDFVAARLGLTDNKAAIRTSFMDDRMAYFAGKYRSDTNGRRKAILFTTGYFRPDLAQQDINKMHG
jgi:hypothetical protein